MIYLSASSIKEFVECNKRYQWRMTRSEDAVETPEMRAGTIVHTILELFWDKKKQHNLTKAYAMAEANNIPDRLIDRIGQSISNFHDSFQSLCTENDRIEVNFKLKMEDDVYLVGKMDRVVEPSGLVLDWKTSEYPVASINDDIQFLIYYYAYTRLYNHPPSLVAYVSLMKNRLINLDIDRSSYDYVINDIIPGMITQIRSSNYYRVGLFNKKCTRCQFKEICLN